MRCALAFVVLALALTAQLPPPPDRLPEGLPVATRFAKDALVEVPRAEYPRPTFERIGPWMPLNGAWELAFGANEPFAATIRVPFAIESALSGQFAGQEIHENLKYRRPFVLPAAMRAEGHRVLLHFEAVDWQATVSVDGKEVGDHRGGYGRFGFDVTDALAAGDEHVIEVLVYDPVESSPKAFAPRGKQLGSHGIWYTRTTGIWQSVWIESVPMTRLAGLEVRAAVDGSYTIETGVLGPLESGWDLRLTLKARGKDERLLVARHLQDAAPKITIQGRLEGIRPWSPEDPALATLELEVIDPGDRVVDRVRSYAGFRSVGFDAEGRFTLNGAPYFLRGVLDQGYWPEGGLTAPSDDALRADVEIAKALGFNLARKHTKLEDARWYHWCDRLGLLVMQDMPSSHQLPHDEARRNFLAELGQMVDKVGNHPSVVHWVAFNEDWGQPGTFQDEAVKHLRNLDPSRLVTDASGWTQRQDTDVSDVHDYGGDLVRHRRTPGDRPKLIGECGGIAFSLDGHRWSPGWGYTRAASPEAFVRRVGRLAAQPFGATGLSGYVWTQLTDVEQELNGLVHYDRSVKAPLEKLREAILGLGGREEPLLVATRWWVLGPLPTPEAPERADDDELGRAAIGKLLAAPRIEAEATLAPGETLATRVGERTLAWKSLPGGATVDLRAIFGKDAERCIVYAVGEFEIPRPCRATLLFGSDDGARVWIGGKLVHEVARVRGASLGDDEIPDLELPKGRVSIVVKIVQGVGGMGLAAAFER